MIQQVLLSLMGREIASAQISIRNSHKQRYSTRRWPVCVSLLQQIIYDNLFVGT